MTAGLELFYKGCFALFLFVSDCSVQQSWEKTQKSDCAKAAGIESTSWNKAGRALTGIAQPCLWDSRDRDCTGTVSGTAFNRDCTTTVSQRYIIGDGFFSLVWGLIFIVVIVNGQLDIESPGEKRVLVLQ